MNNQFPYLSAIKEHLTHGSLLVFSFVRALVTTTSTFHLFELCKLKITDKIRNVLVNTKCDKCFMISPDEFMLNNRFCYIR